MQDGDASRSWRPVRGAGHGPLPWWLPAAVAGLGARRPGTLPSLAPVQRAGLIGPLRSRRSARLLGWLAPLRGLDPILALAVLALGVMGAILVWSASRAALLKAGADPHAYLNRQLISLSVGFILMVAVGRLEPGQLRAWSPLGYAAALLGVVAVLSPLGTSVNGARAWIALSAGFQIEPSEFAKLGLVLMTARILSAGPDTGGQTRMRDVTAALACAAPLVAAVAAEPALGVTILLLVVLLGVIVLSGLRLRWLTALAGMTGAAVIAVWSAHLLKSYQLHRLTAFVNPSADPTGTGYSAMQAKIAVGSGGLLGQGLLHGRLIAGNFVPEQHTDFIFAVAGEELGFIGSLVIILLIGVVICRALLIAARAHDQFSTLLASGIAIWFIVQAFVNIGMNLGIMPVTGLPLPLVSYGGSAMLADMMAIGTLIAIHRRRPLSLHDQSLMPSFPVRRRGHGRVRQAVLGRVQSR